VTLRPEAVVRAALAAAAARDAGALAALCSPGCELGLEDAILGRRDGVRVMVERALAADAGPPPEDVGDGHVLVPLTFDLPIGERTVHARATAIWAVHDGLITSLRCVPGDRDDALRELGLLATHSRRVTADAVRTTWRSDVWANVAGFEVLDRHLGKREAIRAGRRLARRRGVQHVIERQDGTVAMVEGGRRQASRPAQSAGR
jgi:hypothetical protein